MPNFVKIASLKGIYPFGAKHQKLPILAIWGIKVHIFKATRVNQSVSISLIADLRLEGRIANEMQVK